jgi:putative transposase
MWKSTQELSEKLGKPPRAIQRALARSASGKASILGDRVEVRETRSRGGTSGKRYEALLSSLSIEHQATLYRQQPGADKGGIVAAHAEGLEEEPPGGKTSPADWFDVRPITEEMRQALWAHYDRLKGPAKSKAESNLAILTFDQSLAGVAATERLRAGTVLQKFDISLGTLYGLRRRVADADPSDWLPLLAPRHGGDRPKADFTEEAWEHGKAAWLTTNKRNVRSVYRDLERLKGERGWIIPSYATFRRRLYALPRWLQVLLRDGETRFSHLYPAHARLYDALNPHDVWVADGKIGDVMLRDEDGRPYRPVTVTIMDARTRVIVGSAIGKTESADLYRAAFLDAIEKTGVLPRELYLDNHMAAASKMLSGGSKSRFRFKILPDEPLGFCVVLGISIIFALPRWGQSKPLESLHRMHSEMDRKCGKAYLGNRPSNKPPDHDPRAAISKERYKKLFDEEIAAYHLRPHRGQGLDGRSPRAVYDELINKCPVRKATAEHIALCMLSAERVKLDPKDNSVSVWQNRYWAPVMADLPESTFVTARFDPTDLSKPVRVYRDEAFFCEAPIVARTGFRDQESGKTRLRARRQWEKSRKEQARAMVDMRKAESWLTAPAGSGDPGPNATQVAAAKLPAPKIVEPLRPLLELRRTEKKSHGISKADVFEALARRYKISGKS